jgi:hypothetical protein
MFWRRWKARIEALERRVARLEEQQASHYAELHDATCNAHSGDARLVGSEPHSGKEGTDDTRDAWERDTQDLERVLERSL